MLDLPNEKWYTDRIEGILAEFDVTPDPSTLDGSVNSAMAEAATEVNNDGIEAQINHLLRHGWKPQDIIFKIKEGQTEHE